MNWNANLKAARSMHDISKYCTFWVTVIIVLAIYEDDFVFYCGMRQQLIFIRKVGTKVLHLFSGWANWSRSLCLN